MVPRLNVTVAVDQGQQEVLMLLLSTQQHISLKLTCRCFMKH